MGSLILPGGTGCRPATSACISEGCSPQRYVV